MFLNQYFALIWDLVEVLFYQGLIFEKKIKFYNFFNSFMHYLLIYFCQKQLENAFYLTLLYTLTS